MRRRRRRRSKEGCFWFLFSASILFLDTIIVCSSGIETFKHIFNSGALRLDLDLPRSVSVFFEPCGSTASLHRSLEEKIGEGTAVMYKGRHCCGIALLVPSSSRTEALPQSRAKAIVTTKELCEVIPTFLATQQARVVLCWVWLKLVCAFGCD
ncbi:unnamed protein product [Sphagnum balticum]